jgi:hypothetical protein
MLKRESPSLREEMILEVNDLTRHFDVSRPIIERLLSGKQRAAVRAVDGVSFYF